MGINNQVYKERIAMLKNATRLQVNAYTEAEYDAYMHGMANGLILAVATMESADEVNFLESFESKQELEHKAEVLASRPEESIPYDY